MNSDSYWNNDFLNKLAVTILSNLENETFGGKELAQEAGVRVSVLIQRIKLISGKTVSQFIRETRLKRAMEILLREELTAAEVAFKVGFGSPSYFNTCFSEYYGFPPGEVRKKSQFEKSSDGESDYHQPVVKYQFFAKKIKILPEGRFSPELLEIAFRSIPVFLLKTLYFPVFLPGSCNGNWKGSAIF
jgi:AraC-like DNA-binding protein